MKRRTIARQLCENGMVLVNGHEAKPAKDVKPGDILTLKFSSRIIELEIVGMLAASFRKAPPEELYKIKSETKIPKDKDLWSENLSLS